eukprot:CAMPEP_0119266796 /NCGR_PEP_ID=MMETSP1329-20130426/5163_1 /TAXON_ID=114041 /ORGANISM="Genus nov. species nov., Strain RCC1024" /LENGTH=238 /DNA_ID=CAMNT_0007266695 /DNA_START=198 /DNA_END=914 /DNA_ORIENTATION=+
MLHRLLLLVLARADALRTVRVRTRPMSDQEIMTRCDEMGPLVRSFGAQRGSIKGGGTTALTINENARGAAQELVTKRAKTGGAVLVAQRRAAPRDLVGFAIVNPETRILETVSVGVAERGRGVGAALVDAAGEYSRGKGAPELLVEVESRNDGGRKFFEGQGFASTGERRGSLSILSKPLPRRLPVAAIALGLAAAVLAREPGLLDAVRGSFDVETPIPVALAQGNRLVGALPTLLGR